jgi:hypothetical protein
MQTVQARGSIGKWLEETPSSISSKVEIQEFIDKTVEMLTQQKLARD